MAKTFPTYSSFAVHDGAVVENRLLKFDHHDPEDEPVKSGWLAYTPRLSWILTGEMRAYNKMSGTFGSVPVSRSVYQNGKGSWELTARWSRLDLNDGLVEGGDMDIASLGLNWWLTPFFMVNLNYRHIWNTRDGIEDSSSGLNSRILLLLE